MGHGQRGGATLAPPRGARNDPRGAAGDALYPIETSARPSRYVFAPTLFGVLLLFVDLPGFTLQEQAHLTWLFIVIPLLSAYPLWRWNTKEAIDLTDHEIVITRIEGSDSEEKRIPLSGVSDARGIGKPYRRHVVFWTHQQGSSVAVRTGKEEHWFGLCMKAKDARDLAREIVRRAHRKQGGAVQTEDTDEN